MLAKSAGAPRATHLFRRFRLLRRFRRDEKGATAVEFGIVVLPFLALLFAIIETALVFFAGQTLENAVFQSSRLIMTGQAQNQKFDQAQFKTAVCSKIKGLFDCANGLHVDVRCYGAFSPANIKKPVDEDGKLIEDFQYCPGGPEQIIIVRAMYQWPVWVTLLGLNLSDMANGKRLLMATAAFQNEPF